MVNRGDHIRVDLDPSHSFLTFAKESEDFSRREMPEWADPPMILPEPALANGATAETAYKPITFRRSAGDLRPGTGPPLRHPARTKGAPN